jgi:hypothetical protein
MAIKGLPTLGRHRSGQLVYSCDDVWATGRTKAEAFENWKVEKRRIQAALKARDQRVQALRQLQEEGVRATPL